MVDQSHSTEPTVERRLEFETLLADLSSRFISLSPAEVDSQIEYALRRVCEMLDIDYAVLWQWQLATPDVVLPTHVYPDEVGMQPPEPLDQDQYPWYVQQMRAGRMVVARSLDELPAEATIDVESGRLRGIKSNLCIPLSLGGKPPLGALSFNALGAERDWPDAVVQRLRLVALVFTNALARKRHEELLQESAENLTLAADAADAGLWTLDFSTGVFWATERGRAIFGYASDEVIDQDRFEASVHPEDLDRVREAIGRSAGTGTPLTVEYRITHPDSSDKRWIVSRGRPELTPDGEPVRLRGLSIDVTETRCREEALRSSTSRLAAGAELAGLAFYEVDFAAGSMYTDDRLRDLCGVPPDLGQNLEVLEFWLKRLHPDDRDRVLDLRDQLHDGRLDRFSLEYRFLHPERGERWIHHLAGVSRRDTSGRALTTFGVFRDVTQQKQAEEELHDLSRRLIRAHEDERALLARELHDDLTQRLAVLAIDVGSAALAALDPSQVERLASARDRLIRLSEDVHTLAYHLHPSVLTEIGLAEALRAECERLQPRTEVELGLDLDPGASVVSSEAALCLFRVTQAALNNVLRHACARTAAVTLRPADGGLLLTVRDDGVGFDSSSPARGRSLGLAGMRERVRLVDGTLDIESEPGQGAAVITWVPGTGSTS